jgi:hypothetical protein
LGSPYGHVAFGFQIDDQGTVLVGGVEVVMGNTSHVNNAMDFWTDEKIDPLTFMSSDTPYKVKTRYDMAKILSVDTPNVVAARSQIDRIRGMDYNLLSQNCRTDVVDVLQAFGVTGLPGGARPSGFFGGIHAAIVPLTSPWPGLSLDFSIYSETDQYGLRDDPEINADGYVADPTADVNPNGPDWPTPVVGSILVRKGFLALFPDENYSGEAVTVPTGHVFNFRDVPWPDPRIRSWYGSATEFDAASLGSISDQIVPRFETPADRRTHQLGLGLPPHF